MAAKKWTRVAECIYRRGDTFQVRLNNPQTGRKETFGPDDGVFDRKSAFKVRDEQRSKMRDGRRKGKPGETIGGFFARWMDDFPRPARVTNEHYRQQVAPFLLEDAHELDPDEFAATVGVGELRFDQFSKRMARRYAQRNPARTKAVSAMFGDAVQDDLIEANPFHRLGIRRRDGRKRLVVITRDELDVLVDCARAEHGSYGRVVQGMVLTAAWTGIRPGELFALRWADIDWEHSTVTIRRNYRSKTKEMVDYAKTGDQRLIVLPPPAREALRALRRTDERPEVFLTKDGRQFYAVLFQFYWNPVRSRFESVIRERDPGRAGLLFERADGSKKPMDFYELRHFCATYLLEHGVPAHQVAVQLGHKDNGALVLSTYGHPSEDAARDAVRAAFGA